MRVTAAPIVPLDLLCASGTSYFGEPALPYVPGVQGVGVVVAALAAGTRVWFATTAGMRQATAAWPRPAPWPGRRGALRARRGRRGHRPVRGRRVMCADLARRAAAGRAGGGAGRRRSGRSGGGRGRRRSGRAGWSRCAVGGRARARRGRGGEVVACRGETADPAALGRGSCRPRRSGRSGHRPGLRARRPPRARPCARAGGWSTWAAGGDRPALVGRPAGRLGASLVTPTTRSPPSSGPRRSASADSGRGRIRSSSTTASTRSTTSRPAWAAAARRRRRPPAGPDQPDPWPDDAQ